MRFSLSLLFLVVSIGLGAQSLKKFSPDRELYLNELQEFLKEGNDVDEDEQLLPLLNSFGSLWRSDSISEEDEKQIYIISNNFLSKRVKSFEDWEQFLRIIIAFKEKYAAEELLVFLKNFEEVSERPSARISEYLSTVYNVLYRNVLFDDGRLKWELIGSEPEYRFDKEPIFTFDISDLVGYYKRDSTLLEGTEGEYRPRQFIFRGSGGNSYFTRAGLSQDSAYVDLKSYEFDVRKPDFKADSVVLHTKFYLEQTLEGSFEERLTSQGGKGASSATFPRFQSYRNDIVVPNILPNASFTGGFSVIGSKFYGGGNDSSRATIILSYKDTVLIKARSKRFWLRMDKVYSEDVEAVIYLGKDSIYHPKVTMRYLPELGRFSIIRNDNGMGAAVFSDSYHNLDLLFDVITWEVGRPSMVISSLNMGSSSPVVFESNNYYRERRFREIEGLSRTNPLLLLQRLSQSQGGQRTFSDADIAYHLKMDKSDAHRFMMNLSVLGFVEYSVQKREGIIKDKVFEYILNAKGLRDYDVIQFVSRLEQGSNAKLSLEDYSMEVEGIKSIALSDSQRVGLFPYGERIIIHENLNFDFSGQISAGRFNFWGNEFKFNYEQFRIAMTDIDSMRFKVVSFEPNSLGQRYLVDVKTVLQDLTGDLQIDKPNNKSGKNYYSEYPIFSSAKNSYIYYDKPSIFGGVYNREEFFVTLEPFEIDSLDNTSTTGLSFDGVFTSAGIFADMSERIKVQEDYSLGFKRETPSEGLAAYGGKGTFTSQLSLSNQGLRGDGKIDYLNSFALSQEFFFFPDSTDGRTFEYEITEKLGRAGSNPHVLAAEVDLHWEPKNDVLYTTTVDAPFDVYDAIGMRTTGTLAHAPSGLTGRGLNEFYNAETRAKDYTFESRRLLAEATEFKVRANEKANWGFELKNAKAKIDFDEQEGIFNLNDEADYVSFTANRYIALMDYARWDIPQKAIDVKKTKGSGMAEMISVRPSQDSLRFEAERSKFYLENTLLESFKVPEILVADAYIYPDTGYVAIDTNAQMRTLTNSAIMANTYNQFHSFYGATVDIETAHNYTGTADYEFVDQDGTPWPIRFKEIKVDTGTTVGFAQVAQEEGFYMSPYFAYYGNVRLRADEQQLNFHGFTHIESSCPAVSTNWFKFKSKIDPANITIELPEIDPDDKTKMLANGIYLASDTISGYAAFLSQEVRPVDKQMFFANGVLYYDEGLTSYIITEREKISNSSLPINVLRFNNVDCLMEGEGEMSLGDNATQLTTNSYGLIYYDLETDEMNLDLSLGMQFPFSKDLLKKLAEVISLSAEGGGVDIGRPAFKVATNHRLDEDDLAEFNEEVNAFGAPEKVPDDLQQTLWFGDLAMDWTPESISFLSSGKVGLAGLGETFVNAKVDGFVEIQRRRKGDEVYIYLDLRGEDIYIEYKRNIMGIYSTNEEFMNILKEMDIKDRRNEERGRPTFTYTISTKGKMNRFIRRFESVE